ncbi:MAG: type II toxin-antitoxin system PemK/MazF family toxin [Nocardioides sp.]
MPTSGDVVRLDFGLPQGSEAGFPRPGVVVSAAKVLEHHPTVVQVVPLTSKIRGYDSEVLIEAGHTTGLEQDSSAQCQHIRSVAASRLGRPIGAVSSVQLRQIRETLAILLDL